MHRLNGKTAIITGAGRGIGAATAQRFAQEGAAVAILEIDAAAGQAQADAITQAGGKCAHFTCDVTDTGSVERAVAEVTDIFAAPNVLVNNAGVNVFHKPLEMAQDDWDRCMRLDLDAAWICARAVLPGMRAQRTGSIINIASTHAMQIIPHTFPYPVAKHGLIGLTRALGIEYAADGIRVNAIAPGYVETQLALDYWAGFPNPEAERQKAMDLHPPRRIGQPVEVANTALFLASDEAPFINAETIAIDGGRTKLYHE
ncbi:short-chain dehydrogenase [Actibacterium mucosum KCTC 23349]|uniref:Short-chain dehydrogenase n=1 Tax=Actibacterium mucosum KCTC 23349 TaxID=1454373 RepID=A0A037ZLS8_9RHOB|nr:SDR family oxidoreductase [Actibacterium mucosum]KAJ56482.1 short-chain dehydrogenase [Actibacterium mucosum KCTC 23349]